MSNAEQELTKYLQELLIVSRHRLRNSHQRTRRALILIGVVGMAFLTCASACMWSIYGIYKSNASVIEQAMIMQNTQSTMCFTTPQNTNTLVKILPDGKIAVHNTNNE